MTPQAKKNTYNLKSQVVFFWKSSFFRLATSFFGRLPNPVLLVPSTGNGRFRRPFNSSAPKPGRRRKNSLSEEQTIRN